jgi:hypothetical protein
LCDLCNGGFGGFALLQSKCAECSEDCAVTTCRYYSNILGPVVDFFLPKGRHVLNCVICTLQCSLVGCVDVDCPGEERG